LRQFEHCYAEGFDRHVDQLDQAQLGSDNEDNGDNIVAPEDERFTAETLIAAYYTVTKIWSGDCFIAGKLAPIIARLPLSSRPSTYRPGSEGYAFLPV
jgi:hypothetical protein